MTIATILTIGRALPGEEPEPPPHEDVGSVPDIFRIPEILTLILSHLPPVYLVTSARLVCKAWKHEIETDPILRWRCWVPNRDRYLPEKKAAAEGGRSNVLDGISLPPPSIRDEYSNIHCKCSPSRSPSSNWVCNTHIYTDLFEVHPVALHFLQIYWRRFMRVPLAKAEEIAAANSRDALMDELVALIKPKLKEFETAVLVDTPDGIRLNTSNRLIRPETMSAKVYLYCGIQHESLIETILYDNGTRAVPLCQSSRTSRRKMLAVKDLVYNVMHRSSYGDTDINQVRKKQEEEINDTKNMDPEEYKLDIPDTENVENVEPLDGSDEVPKYYTVLIHVEGKNDTSMPNQRRGAIEDTEVEITLALFEPYDIISVKSRRLAHSIQSVRARCLARYSPFLEPRNWKNDFVPKKSPWRRWARDKKPKTGDLMPEYAEVYEYYRSQGGITDE
ncbi:hypothetical protein H072_6714 [Dactylellina haptotyla CBS 200.50]|uniref:F-box domain-containing protein n=1 Tax=Dactylellina haptotyla (strain CBS 200.50) TaxID=1284197 RepID=S8BW57_DACHA|nr:hypothetical protein H072_6714 [Dactylellina haptotyla CBS 200.50]